MGNPPREKDRERDREKEREQHKALQTLGAQLQDLMRNGPEDWLELWQLELECIKDIKNRAKRRDHEAEARNSDDAGLGAVDCSLGAAGRHVRRCGVCNVELSSV